MGIMRDLRSRFGITFDFCHYGDPLTVNNNKTRYVAGEFGVALLVVFVLMAIYFWRRRDEVELATRAATSPK
jgi:hypothetical protein